MKESAKGRFFENAFSNVRKNTQACAHHLKYVIFHSKTIKLKVETVLHSTYVQKSKLEGDKNCKKLNLQKQFLTGLVKTCEPISFKKIPHTGDKESLDRCGS